MYADNSSETQVATPAPIAAEALVRIAAVYAIEADIRGPDDRKQARQRRNKPLIDALRLWLEAKFATVSSKATMADALRTRSHAGAGLLVSSTTVASRSTPTPRAFHPLAGSDGGGVHWAVVTSLIEGLCSACLRSPLGKHELSLRVELASRGYPHSVVPVGAISGVLAARPADAAS